MKITEDTYFNYLDGLLSAEETQSFEDYLSKNPESKEKIKQLQQSGNQLMNLLNDPIISKLPEQVSKRLFVMQEKIDQRDSSQNKIREFFVNMFKPLFEIPAQAKIFVAAMGLGLFFVGNNLSIQVAETNNNDVYTAFINNSAVNDFLNTKSNFKSFMNVTLNNKSYYIKDNSNTHIQTKSGNILNIDDIEPFNNTELNEKYLQPINICPDDNVQKDITLSSDNSTQFITLCSLKGGNKWKIVKIEITQNEKEIIGISDIYKLFKNN